MRPHCKDKMGPGSLVLVAEESGHAAEQEQHEQKNEPLAAAALLLLRGSFPSFGPMNPINAVADHVKRT